MRPWSSCLSRLWLVPAAAGLLFAAGCGSDPSSPPPPPDNQPPTATIIAPTANATFTVGQAVTCTGAGTDPEDGTLVGASLAWRSTLDGALGTGGSIAPTGLSEGTHLLILTATDSDGGTGADSVRITIEPSGPIVRELRWIALAGGDFDMGTPDTEPGRDTDEGPVHTVGISAFETTDIEVTTTHYSRWLQTAFDQGLVEVVGDEVRGSASGLHPGRIYLQLGESKIQFASDTFTVDVGAENEPAMRVTWYGADAFCINQGWRLPTEAEWEYACRAGTSTALYNGALAADSCEADAGLEAIGWYCGNASALPQNVHQKLPNAFGLYDCSGSALEWCNDWYGRDYYQTAPRDNPPGPTTGLFKVARGGSWEGFAKFCRSGSRVWQTPEYLQSTTIGFRPVRVR